MKEPTIEKLGGFTLKIHYWFSELENRPFQEQIRAQAQIAIDEADVIVFVVDAKVGISADDRLVAKILYKTKKPVI